MTGERYGNRILTFFLSAAVIIGGVWYAAFGRIPFSQEMIELNGALARRLNLREINKDSGGIVLSNGYVAGIYPYTSTEYEIQQITDFKDYLDSRGVSLLYVSEPAKYIEDEVVEQDLGQRTYINQNTDRFLAGLRENGIPYIDIREEIRIRGLNSFDLFYKTDHHWTPAAGKLAAEAIAVKLNADFGYSIDLSLYDSDHFSYTEYKNAWLGEQGRKLGETFVGLDDFTLVAPEYSTSFLVQLGGAEMKGAFEEVMIDHTVYLPERNSDVYAAPSWHYSYMGKQTEEGIVYVNGSKVLNYDNMEGKRILVLGDSYEQTMIPFLALGVSEVQCLVLRDFGGNLREYIASQDIDTVVIAYAAFMLGAHDDKTSANYTMFDF